MLQIYQPIEEVKQEDVVLVTESKEDMMKEFEKAALRLDKAKLVSSLLFKDFQVCLI
jgi:large subunit ribosomal protein L9